MKANVIQKGTTIYLSIDLDDDGTGGVHVTTSHLSWGEAWITIFGEKPLRLIYEALQEHFATKTEAEVEAQS